MVKKAAAATSARRPRADAQRNRERILEVAREVFTQHGAEATLDEIARRAGVGPGTLYRHFPTRDALIEAVFRSQVEKLTEAGEHFAATMQPVPALRAWMLLFIEYVSCKLLIMPAMDTVPGGSVRLIEGSRGTIHGSFRKLVQRAIDCGEFRPEMEPDDVIRSFLGVFQTALLPGWEVSMRRIVDILIDGSRATNKRPAG